MRRLFSLMAVLALCGCATSHDNPELFLLTPEHFRDTAQIVDDSLETTATISMEPGYHEHNNINKDGWSCDSYLRAFVDKRSGRTTYQLYVDVGYISHERRLYDSVNYKTPEGIQSAALIKIARDKNYCRRDKECEHDEVVGLNLPEGVVREIAATYSPNAQNPWLFKLKGRILNEDMEDGIVPAEAAGLLMAVQAYKASLHR